MSKVDSKNEETRPAILFNSKLVYVKCEYNFEVPWFRIYEHQHKRELTDCDKDTLQAIFDTALIIENAMRDYYGDSIKVTHISLGIKKPEVHWHVIGRFENDPWWPEITFNPTRKYEKGSYKDTEFLSTLPSLDDFLKKLVKELKGR